MASVRRVRSAAVQIGGYSVFSIQYSVFSIQYSVFSIQYSVFSIQYSVFSIQYSVFSTVTHKMGHTLMAWPRE
ncbi:hypothetical protein EDWATA_00705 [Edwardsiella tarda ATCC 23685]|uniref:Uncharacterized protein n=1 Tax=Edwardsiella tarda ATCC 23685 TaxID=500638 RepID=D4F1W1_EDWTA|nr:hypothetical protein EDWATA_00705 [Edwardsiella tarda ATCC 23685]